MKSHVPLDCSISLPTQGGPSFTLRNRLIRLLWNVSWAILAAWTPTPFYRYRVALIRMFGGEVDWSAHVYGSARIWLPSNLQMGPHSCIGPDVNCYCMGRITLEAGAIVSQGATLCAGSHDIHDADFQLVTKPIIVRKQAWVAAEAFLGPGVTVGESAVIGARAVLFSDASSNGIYVGNPAKRIKDREVTRKCENDA